jgi:hypothetical protein
MFLLLSLISFSCSKLPRELALQLRDLSQKWLDSSSPDAAAAIALEQRQVILGSGSNEHVKIWNDFRCLWFLC